MAKIDKVVVDNKPKIRGVFDSTDDHPGTSFVFDENDPKVIANECRTVQAGSEDTDVNVILRKYGIGRVIESNLAAIKAYGDVSELPDYHEAMNTVIRAQDAFMALSADVRNRFNNDPAQFLEFMSKKDENFDEAVKLGLAVPRKVAPDLKAPMPPKADDAAK